jgi:hypothetical protein
MSAVPLSGTGAGPRPDPTTFTRAATERRAADGARTDRSTADRPGTDRSTADRPGTEPRTDDATQ